MLHFFRKYERYFFIVITVVIVISFSFFGTYSSMQKTQYVDKTAFTAIDGTEISQSELQQFTTFISTDNDDKILFGGAWGLNFLNDGVIKKDFLQTDLALSLAEPFLEDFKNDLVTKHQKEKKFKPYSHPEASFLSAVNIWNVLAPGINQHLNALKKMDDPSKADAFKARIDLYLAEQKFPQTALRYTLHYQQKQFNWISEDPNLNRTDLSLFGYHTINDWFGQRFINLIAEFIINASAIAENMGYFVSNDEALAELINNAEISFQQNVRNPNLGVATSDQYFQEQLRRMGMDRSTAVKILKQIMLFRRVFNDVGSSVFVDSFTHKQIQSVAHENVTGELYQLPEDLRFSNLNSLEKFEIYLKAVSERPESAKEQLHLPKKFYSVDVVSENYPDLVQKEYQLEIAQVSKNELQTKAGIKETWEWEVQNKNWEKLKNKFPQLGLKDSQDKNERYKKLDELDKKTRNLVDKYARKEIVEENPDWITKALLEKEFEKKTFSINKSGKNDIFPSIKDPKKLMELFDQYPKSESELSSFTIDDQTYYKIKVLDVASDWEILTFAEAEKTDALDKILDSFLEKQYEKVKEENKEKYFDEKESNWKPYYQVKKEIAKEYFAPLLEEIKNHYYSQTEGLNSKELLDEKIASLRMFAYMQKTRENFIEDYEKAALNIANSGNELNDQFNLIKSQYSADRTTQNTLIDIEEAYTLTTNEWTNVQTKINGDLNFFQLKEKIPGDLADKFSLYKKVMDTYRLVSKDSQKALLKNVLDEMLEKNALTLKFMERSQEELNE